MNPTVVPIDEVMADLDSPSWTAVRDAVARVADALAQGLDAAKTAEIALRLGSLAKHRKWEVRRAVASALQHLHHDSYEITLARLLEDDNADVQAAANRVLVRRTELARGELESDEVELLRKWAAPIGKRFGRPAMNQAMRLATRYADVFVGQAVHEIVKVISPLSTSLLNLSTELRRTELDRRKAKKHVGTARSQLEILSAITRSLQAFTKDVTPEFQRVDLKRLVNDAIVLAKHEAPKRVPIDVEVPRGLSIDADRPRIALAFSNIIKNAYEAFSGRKTRDRRIRIEATPRGEAVVLAFTDNGCGMPQDALDDALTLFSTSKGPGRGLGLPFAKKIIEGEHRGSLGLTSVLDEGTTVSVTLPIEQVDE